MTEVEAMLNEQGLVDPPLHKCYKDEAGLCKLRRLPDSEMMCVFKPERCRFRRPTHTPD